MPFMRAISEMWQRQQSLGEARSGTRARQIDGASALTRIVIPRYPLSPANKPRSNPEVQDAKKAM